MQGVSQPIGQAVTGPDDLIFIARVVQILVPAPTDDVARKALICMAFRRFEERVTSSDLNQMPDCLSAAFERTVLPTVGRSADLSPDLARIISLAFQAYAGDLSDPSEGADFVARHAANLTHPENLCPVALIGDFLFFKISRPIC